MEKLADCDRETGGGCRGEAIQTLGEGICFKHIDFSYDAEKPVLKDVSLQFETGRWILTG